jgi:hypothetical protein
MLILYTDINAWFQPSRLSLISQAEIDISLYAQIESGVLARLATVFDTTGWVDEDHTPELVKTILSMYYAAWTYDKAYSDDGESNAFADKLRSTADLQMSAIISGSVLLTDPFMADQEFAAQIAGGPTFYPNDLSSSMEPTADDPSAGGPSFTMGSVF